MLCLNCRYVSRAGSDFCQRCGRSLGARLCPKKHVSPMDAAFCGVCGSPKLSKAARCVPLSWVSRLLAWIGIGLVLMAAAAHAGAIGAALGTLLAHVFCWAVHIVFCCFGRLIAFLVAVQVLSHLLPETYGKPVRHALQLFVRLSWRAAVLGLRALAVCGRLLIWLVNGRKVLSEKGKA